LLFAAVAIGLLTVFAESASAAPEDLQIWVDPDGTAYIYNTTAWPISFDGYQITSESKNLDPVAWDSISDRFPARINELIGTLGVGSVGFGEANPTDTNLAELNLSGVGTLAAGAKFSLGKPFKSWLPNLPVGDDFFWKGVPEPSTWLLATLAALGCAAIRRRRVAR
jgi:hypothetical protein